MALSALQQPQRSVPALTDAVVSPPVECMGLVLGSELGKRTRLGSNLLPVWQEYAEFAFLGNRLTVNGTSTHVVQSLCTTGDWHFRHVSCTGKAAEPIRAKDGSQACSLCFGLGSDKNFLHRIARFVRSLDMARLLHAKIYANDTVDTLLDSMTQKAVFKERNAKDYQQFFDMETRQLQQEVRQIFHGIAQQRTTSAMHYFCAHVVFPCLQVHPDHVLQGVGLDTFYRLLQTNSSVLPADVQLVKQIACGQMHRRLVCEDVTKTSKLTFRFRVQGLGSVCSSRRVFRAPPTKTLPYAPLFHPPYYFFL